MAGLNTQERSRVLYHLGYLNVAPAASLSFGIPRPIQTLFLVETAMNNLIDDGFNVQNVRRILGQLDKIECLLSEAPEFLVANKLGNMELNAKNPELLEIEYCRWMARLADVFGVPAYPYSLRAQQLAGTMGGNIRVRR